METRDEKKLRVIEQKREGVIVLEDIHDPHNAAAVWRSCDAFGFHKVYLIFTQEKKFDPKKVGKVVSSGANKWLEFKIFETVAECNKKLKGQGYTIYATVLDNKATSLENVKFGEGKMAVYFGNEHRGLSKEAIGGADKKIYIPMKGMVQSLNLSVTAAVVMWEISRQRKNRDELAEEEKERLLKTWRWA